MNTTIRHKIKKLRLIFGILTGVVIVGCAGLYTTPGLKWNLGAIYNPASSPLHPAYRVYHHNDQNSLLLIKLFPSELLFNQANETGEFISKVSVQLQAYEIDDRNPVLVDSVTYIYTIKQENVGRRFLTQIPFKADTGKRYQLRIVARDLLRRDFNLRFIDVDKTSPWSEQNFNLLNQNGIPYFNNVLVPKAIYKIEQRHTGFDTLFIHYYRNETTVPGPNFGIPSDDILYRKADSIYILPYSKDLLLSFSDVGMYHFRFDTNYKEGLSIVNFGEDFPKIKSPEELIEPLAYIATSADYEKLLKAVNKKLANDNFWLEQAKTTGRARELIRVYYNRVYFANYYFSNTKPGWKTDRGMIYIVYGPPGNMEKTPNSETWIYNPGGGQDHIRINFNYKPTPYNLDNYTLIRSESQNWKWTEAVNSWRSGKIFLSD